MITKNVLQISLNPPKDNVIKLIKKYFPDWDYYHFNDEKIIEYFKNNPLKEFPNCINRFNELPIGAWKADLFRYYFLYINGGVFIDDDAMIHYNINDIIKDYSGVFIKSNFFESLGFEHIFNGFIYITPKHPIMYQALKHIYKLEIKYIDNYQVFCIELLKIINKLKIDNIKIFNETIKKEDNKLKSIILDDNGNKLLTHYFEKKIIDEDH